MRRGCWYVLAGRSTRHPLADLGPRANSKVERLLQGADSSNSLDRDGSGISLSRRAEAVAHEGSRRAPLSSDRLGRRSRRPGAPNRVTGLGASGRSGPDLRTTEISLEREFRRGESGVASSAWRRIHALTAA